MCICLNSLVPVLQGAVQTPPVPAWAAEQPSFVGIGAPAPLPGSAAATAAAAKRSLAPGSHSDSPRSVDNAYESDLKVLCATVQTEVHQL